MFDRIIGILGFIIGIVGIYLSVKSNREKRPLFFLRNIRILNDYVKKRKSIKVLYNEEILENIL